VITFFITLREPSRIELLKLLEERRSRPNFSYLGLPTKKPVTKQTIARWLKQVLLLAGISQYGAHSYRGAGLSNAFAKGVSIDEIVKAGDWTNATTFKKFYNKPSESSNVGRIILDREVRTLGT
jgi:hypothetical protein